jgi:hypothetical protein
VIGGAPIAAAAGPRRGSRFAPIARRTRDDGTAVPPLSFAPRQIGIGGGCADDDGGGWGLPRA